MVLGSAGATLPKRSGPRTQAEWLAPPEGHRLELVDGDFVEKASPSSEHGVTQTRLGIRVGGPFMRRPGGRSPGGWWIGSEGDIILGPDLFRPDLVGWRHDRVAAVPSDRPTAARLNVLAATAKERVRPEPFGAVEFLVASFFDDAEDDAP